MSHFFSSFGKEIIRIVFTIFVVAMKDLELQSDNSNLLLEKSAIWFELLAQKGETSKQKLLHYTINPKTLFYKDIYLSMKNIS